MDKTNPQAYYNRASLRKIKGNCKGAREDINRAIRLDPSNTYYRSLRALLFRETGQFVEAAKEINTCRVLELKHNKDSVGIQLPSSKADPVLESLAVDPEKRSSINLFPIIGFLQHLKFFTEIGENNDLAKKIAQKCTLKTYQKGDYIFEEGHPGDEFYVIISGEVNIVKKRQMYDYEELNEMVNLITLKRGASFGETAIETSAGLRTASALALTNTHLLVLNADGYRDILSQYKLTVKQDVRKELLSANSPFRKWPIEKIDILTSFAIIRYFRPDTPVIEAGKKVNSLMLIRKGVVKITKAVPIYRSPVISPKHSVSLEKGTNFSGDIDVVIDEYGKEDFTKLGLQVWVDTKLNNSFHDVMNISPNSKLSRSMNHGSTSRSFINTRSSMQKLIDEDSDEDQLTCSKNSNDSITEERDFTMAVLLSGQIFGELSLLYPDQLSKVSAISSTALEVYCFERDILIELGILEDQKIMRKLKESFDSSDQSPEEIEFKFKSKFAWELEKKKIIRPIAEKAKRL